MIDIILTTAASDHIDDRAYGHAPTNNITDPDIQLREAQRRTENVKQGFDPERIDECAVLVDVWYLEQDSKEEKREEAVIALAYDGVQVELALINRENGKDDGQRAESNTCLKLLQQTWVRNFCASLCLSYVYTLTESKVEEPCNIELPSHFYWYSVCELLIIIIIYADSIFLYNYNRLLL